MDNYSGLPPGLDPARRYLINGTSCPVLSAVLAVAAGNDNLIVPAVTGKIIRMMALEAGTVTQPDRAAGSNCPYITLKTGLAGTPRFLRSMPAGELSVPEKDSGYFDCALSTAMYVDVGILPIYMTVFYIAYPPS